MESPGEAKGLIPSRQLDSCLPSKGSTDDDLQEATLSSLSIVVVAFAAALPFLPAIVGLAGLVGVGESAALASWLKLFGTILIGMKVLSMALGIGWHLRARDDETVLVDETA